MSDSSSSSSEESSTQVKRPLKRKTAAEIRKINREKRLQAHEGFEETRTAALDYLKQYTDDRAAWKFNKAKQLWLVRHMYVESKIPEDVFPSLVQYLRSAGQGLRTTVLKDAKLISQPITATTPELQTARKKALGLLTALPTKSNPQLRKLSKKKMEKEGQETNKDGDVAEQDAGADKAEDPEDAEEDATDAALASTPQTVVDRALVIIEELEKPVPKPEAPEKKSKKRKSSDDEDSDASESKSDDESEDGAPKKKSKKSKDKKDKKAKKSKSDKKEKVKDKKDKDKKDKDKKKDKKEKKEKKEKKKSKK
ncbi:hypothetical protein FB645_005780 [Coemansia sp. IMI 203386]|nr:hypothetical protein FB645_005780 [Coemansia sp. IMI 203386]